MIEAAKTPWFTRWFAGHAEARIRRAFSSVRILGLDTLRAELAKGPVLVVSNHTAWWDALVSLVICERLLGADAYAMMDVANLRALPFFARVGAFGVSLEDPADGARAIRYAANQLRGPGKLVWIFPQGREVPVTARPLGFRPGSEAIARVARDAAVVSVGLRYEHGKAPEPSLWIAIGPLATTVASSTAGDHEQAVTRQLERIDRALIDGADEGFDVLFAKRESRWARAAQAMLSWITRPRGLR